MKTETLGPCPLKARILLWEDLSNSDMEEIEKAEFTADIERILCHALRIELPEPRLGILLQLYTNIVIFCREQNFNREQTSVLLSIVKNVHQHNTETPLNNMDQCFTYCTELLLCHSVRRPPFSISLFSSEQMTKVLKYFINTYMRHYVLYKYIFTPQMYLDLSLSYIGMSEDTATDEPTRTECVADAETEMEKDVSKASEQEKEILTPNVETIQDPSPKAELRTIVEKEVKEEVMRITAQLEQRLQESTDQLKTALSALETSMQSRK